jgi:hypothetical protein
MEAFMNHPAVQAGVAPFIAGLFVALILYRLRLGGLAVIAGFATAVWLITGFTFSPLTATRKIILLVLAAPVIGVLVDFAFKPTRLGAALIAMAAGIAVVWVFFPVLTQKELIQALLVGGVAVLSVVWMVGFMLSALADRPVQCAAAGLMMGLGAGALAIMGASASYGQYGIALGAGAGAFLLVMMITGRAHPGGATLALTASLASGLLVAGTMILAQLQWYAVAIFALTPLAARMPGPARSPIWVQAFVHALYAVVPVIAACAIAYYGSRGASS